MIQKPPYNYGIILLAAGTSSRLGKPKQLLMYQGQTLLARTFDVAKGTSAREVVVVLGANASELQAEISHTIRHVVLNAGWEEGIASSIREGIKTLVDIFPETEGAVLMLCDQPFVTTELVEDLVLANIRTGKPIISCSYAGTFGPPTFFHRSVFPELLQLKGDTGARSILKAHADEVETIEFQKGSLDIDTMEDYATLINEGEE